MDYLGWLIRAKRWAQNPPSGRQVLAILAVLGFCLVIVGIEKFIGWPDWMKVNSSQFKP